MGDLTPAEAAIIHPSIAMFPPQRAEPAKP